MWVSKVGTTIAAAAKSCQLCPTLCDPIDGSPPGSPVPEILQARTPAWVAISFSNAWKWNVKVKSLSCVRLLAIPWTVAYQAPPSIGFSRQKYWSGLPLPSLKTCTTNIEYLWKPNKNSTRKCRQMYHLFVLMHSFLLAHLEDLHLWASSLSSFTLITQLCPNRTQTHGRTHTHTHTHMRGWDGSLLALWGFRSHPCRRDEASGWNPTSPSLLGVTLVEFSLFLLLPLMVMMMVVIVRWQQQICMHQTCS